MAINENKLHELIGKILGDAGGAMTGALAIVGDKLGLYKAMADGAAVTPAELARKSGCVERYVREWLCAQAAAGYVNYDENANAFSMSPEQALVFADENGPAFFPAMCELIAAMYIGEPKVARVFREGGGVGWHEHDPRLFRGTERFFRPSYAQHLLSEWIPALAGIEPKLREGGSVADIGCGHGASTVLMGKAFPNSRFVGFDYHDASIARAREIAEQAGVADRVRFERAAAKNFPGSYDLIAYFDCLHDMGDPVGAAAHAREALKPGGAVMVVEPAAGDEIRYNLNPISRVFYAASTMFCVPGSLSQEVGLGLGAQAGEKRLSEVLKQGGFQSVRRAAETPFNLVLEARL